MALTAACKKDDRSVKLVKGAAWDSERTMARIMTIGRLIQTANCVILRVLCGREVARGSPNAIASILTSINRISSV